MDRIRELIDLRCGLRVYQFFGYAFLGAAVVVVASSFLPPYEPGLIVFKVFAGLLFFGGFAALLLRKARKVFDARVNVLRDGIVIEASVVSHGRAFVFWKSTRDYVVGVEFEHAGTRHRAKSQSPKAEIHDQLPTGSRLPGLFEPQSGRSLFLQSLGHSLSAV
ncbi:MAG: hypothetical protein GVY23_02895 [Spirochaetes bacterium]|jgi:hypothetical protein|nr:hypothetical protein [Spirochaetota bacterium]